MVEDSGTADFVPVMVFRVDPEHRDGRYAVVGAHLARELYGRDRLQERV